MKSKLLIKFFLGSLFAFVLSVGLMSFHGLPSLEHELFSPNPFSSRRPYYRTRSDSTSIVTVLSITTENSATDTYLNACRQITRRLQQERAALVIIPLANIARSVNTQLLDELARSPVTLFSTDLPASSGWGRVIDRRGSWWVNHPAYGLVDIPWGIASVKPFARGTLFKIAPYQFRESFNGDTIPDIALLAAHRYLNPSEPLNTTRTPYDISTSTLRVPLESDGYTYVRAPQIPWPAGMLYAESTPKSDSLRFGVMNTSYSLDRAWKFYSGKIVILQWNWLRDEPWYGTYAHSMYYSAVLKAFIGKEFVARYDEFALIIIFGAITLLTFLFYRLPLWIGSVTAVLMMVAAVFIPRWLYASHNVLIEPLYVLLAILLSMILLPIFRVVEERRIALETIRSLEDENHRLEELLKTKSR